METFAGYLDRLASSDPTPGGGSAAALVAASGAALVAMVARITSASPKAEAHHELAGELAALADDCRGDLLAARESDERAYASVVAAMALPKSSPEEKAARTAELQSALEAAAEEPLRTAALALRVLELADRALALENTNLASDLGCAASFAQSAVEACAYNVRINHRYMKNAAVSAAQSTRLGAIEERAAILHAGVRSETLGVLRLTP